MLAADFKWEADVADCIAPRQQGSVLKDEADLPVAAGLCRCSTQYAHAARHWLNDTGDHSQ
jgi:hypothetical protein